MDLEAGIYLDDPKFEEVVDRLSSLLFQVSSGNGKVAELLRRRTGSPELALQLVQANQMQFRQLKPEIEELQLWKDPTPSQKYSQHKLSSDFSKLFNEFKHLQEQFLNHVWQNPEPEPLESQGSADEQMYSLNTNAPYTDDPQVIEQELAFDEQLRQDEVSYQQGLVADREQEIEHIAQGMNELNEIFENLGELVRDQGVTLDNIESNMYTTVSQVHAGSQQLTKAQRWQRASTGRMCYFLVILLVVLLVVVLAVSL